MTVNRSSINLLFLILWDRLDTYESVLLGDPEDQYHYGRGGGGGEEGRVVTEIVAGGAVGTGGEGGLMR